MARSFLVPAALALSALACAAVAATTVDSRAARDLLFPERGRAVAVSEVDFLDAAVKKQVEQYAATMDYYSALAVSPGDPASTGSALAATGHHSPEAAQRAALAGCNARRTTGAACVVVATVLPRGYKPQALTLSVEATKAVRTEFRKLSSPKALAISATSGAFAMKRGDGGRAIAACNAASAKKGGAQDCAVAVFDR